MKVKHVLSRSITVLNQGQMLMLVASLCYKVGYRVRVGEFIDN